MAEGGQFSSARGGQFEWVFHPIPSFGYYFEIFVLSE